MMAMFGVFTVWFFYDASIGYRAKNEVFFMEKAFHRAVADFNRLNASGDLTPEEWSAHAQAQHVEFPDEDVLPTSLILPVAWPEILQDYEKVRPLQAHLIWLEFTRDKGWDAKVAEQHYTPRKIHEQWVVFWICLVLTLVTIFFLVRTLRRSMSVDEEAVTDSAGKRVAYEDLTLLDLRKWDTKGIAFAEYQSPSGSGRLRLDGLTYGGFRDEDNQPAERLMEALRSRFTGEILEYAEIAANEESAGPEAAPEEPAGEPPAERS